MINKNMFNIIRLVFILTASLAIFFSTGSLGYAKPIDDSQVVLTVPSSIAVQQTGQGDLVVSDFVIENKMPVGFNIENISVAGINGWSLDKNSDKFGLNSKSMMMSIDNQQLTNGDNPMEIKLNPNSKKTMKIDVSMYAFDHQSSEQAFNLVLDYKLIPKEFTITLSNPRVGTYPPIKALCGEKVNLPEVNHPNFIGWHDIYKKEYCKNPMVMPVGGTRIVAVYRQMFFNVDKFKALPFMGVGPTVPKSITGLTFKSGIPEKLDFEYWDVSTDSNMSIICYRESQDPNSSRYNDIIVAADSTEITIDGKPFQMFYTENGPKTPLKYFRAENLNFAMGYGVADSFFEGCEELVDISGMAHMLPVKFKSMRRMFKDCNKLKDFSPLNNLVFDHLTNTTDIFSGTAIEDASFVKNWNLANALAIDGSFKNCPNLKQIDLSTWDIPAKCYIKDMFLGTPIEQGYAKTTEMAERINTECGLANKCFQVKPTE